VALSLRGRLMLGAILWTAGLIVVAALAITHTMPLFPRANLVGLYFPFVKPMIPISIATAAMVCGLLLVRRGLSPVNRLRDRLSSVHSGREQRVQGTYPLEVQPLVDDLNALLEERERAVARALAKAADLAHGLKTPLSVLAQDAEQARAGGAAAIADSIAQQVDRMRRQIEYHLAQARAADAAPTTRTSVSESADGLLRTLRRLHAEKPLAISATWIDTDCAVRVQREDLDEMLGNVLDNACKWARSRVVLDVSRVNGHAQLSVDDDGPGLEPALRTAVLQRGVRADENVPGSGLGLAITRDLVELYAGTLTLDRGPLGGLRVQITLPEARAAST
jgi:signal transduction histidine kinase